MEFTTGFCKRTAPYRIKRHRHTKNRISKRSAINPPQRMYVKINCYLGGQRLVNQAIEILHDHRFIAESLLGVSYLPICTLFNQKELKDSRNRFSASQPVSIERKIFGKGKN